MGQNLPAATKIVISVSEVLQHWWVLIVLALGAAIFLVKAALSGIDLKELTNELNKYMAVTPMKIIGIANRYFFQKGILLNIKTK